MSGQMLHSPWASQHHLFPVCKVAMNHAQLVPRLLCSHDLASQQSQPCQQNQFIPPLTKAIKLSSSLSRPAPSAARTACQCCESQSRHCTGPRWQSQPSAGLATSLRPRAELSRQSCRNPCRRRAPAGQIQRDCSAEDTSHEPVLVLSVWI